MNTEVILLSSIKGLGAEGDRVAVKPGFARNYLLPRRLAMPVTLANVKQLENLKKRRSEREAAELQQARDLAARLEAIKLTIPMQVGQNNKVFGAVTANDLLQQINAQGFELERRQISLPQPIKQLGNFTVEVKLNPELSAQVPFTVVSNAPEEQKAEGGREARDGKREPRKRTTKKESAQS